MSRPRRHPLAVVPDPRRPYLVRREDVKAAFREDGLPGLVAEVRSILTYRVAYGRATSRDEVAVMREWLRIATAEQVAHLVESLTGPRVREVPDDEPVTAAETAFCSACGDPFTRQAGAPGRPRARCWKCSPAR